jgi:hypothetical protein
MKKKTKSLNVGLILIFAITASSALADETDEMARSLTESHAAANKVTDDSHFTFLKKWADFIMGSESTQGVTQNTKALESAMQGTQQGIDTYMKAAGKTDDSARVPASAGAIQEAHP